MRIMQFSLLALHLEGTWVYYALLQNKLSVFNLKINKREEFNYDH